MKKYEFYWLDVFSHKELEGNQLAVFPRADKLSGTDMQRIALEMNLSETTFITGYHEKSNGEKVFRTRIFTKEEELPFAGHPSLGTAYLMSVLHDLKDVKLSLEVGEIPVTFKEDSLGVYGEMRQKDPHFGNMHKISEIAQIFNVQEGEISDIAHVQTVSTGNPFIIVPFRNLKTVQNLRPDHAKMTDYLRSSDANFFYPICFQTVHSNAVAHARMIFYGGEDPATGSAAGPAAAWMLKYGILGHEKAGIIEQGIEINRPSMIYVKGSLKEGIPCDIRVGGYCSLLGKGEISLSS